MARTQRSNGSAPQLPDPATIFQAQFEAAENATRIVGATSNCAMSINRAWLDLWVGRMTQMLELPKRLVHMQIDFMEDAFDDYQESMQQLGRLAIKASHEAEHRLRDTAGPTKAAAQMSLEPSKGSKANHENEGGKASRENRSEKSAASERRAGERRVSAH